MSKPHVCLGFPGIAVGDDDYYATQVLINALGGGASSRLFQEVREKSGGFPATMLISIHTVSAAEAATGAYASTRPANVGELINVMVGEIADVAGHGLNDGEIKQKPNSRGGLLLGMGAVVM